MINRLKNKKSKKQLLITSLFGLFLITGSVTGCGNNQQNGIDINEYIEVKVEGYDGVGKNGEILWPSNRWGGCKYDSIDWLSFLNLK